MLTGKKSLPFAFAIIFLAAFASNLLAQHLIRKVGASVVRALFTALVLSVFITIALVLVERLSEGREKIRRKAEAKKGRKRKSKGRH